MIVPLLGILMLTVLLIVALAIVFFWGASISPLIAGSLLAACAILLWATRPR